MGSASSSSYKIQAAHPPLASVECTSDFICILDHAESYTLPFLILS